MRTYIFTSRERRVIQSFLVDKIGVTERDLSKIRSRIKLFGRLRNDIFLYLEFYDALMLASMTESSGAVTE